MFLSIKHYEKCKNTIKIFFTLAGSPTYPTDGTPIAPPGGTHPTPGTPPATNQPTVSHPTAPTAHPTNPDDPDTPVPGMNLIKKYPIFYLNAFLLEL